MAADSVQEPHLPSDDELTVPVGLDATATLIRIGERLREPGPIRPQVDLDESLRGLPQQLPALGCEANALVDELARFATAFSRRNAQPGFLGFICSPGLPTDPVAHGVRALLNQNVSGFVSAPGASAIEQRVVSWFTQLCGFPDNSAGGFVAGGSMSNFIGLASAVYSKAGDQALEQGIGQPKLVIYCSSEAHFSVERAVRILGLGSRALCKVGADASFRLSPDLLEAAIQRDLAQGKVPCAVVATMGTTATGAIDPLAAIAAIAQRYALWLHIDAAYGGAALLAPGLRARLGDFSTADSVGIDLHKWLYVALDAGLILLRDPSRTQRVFDFHSDYVAAPSGARDEGPNFLHLGLEASRPFRALGPYWALRQYGGKRLGNNIQFNADCARYLADCVRFEPELTLITEPELSICCFRYRGSNLTENQVDDVNERIRAALESEGRHYLSATRVSGRPVLRACLVSSATRPEHLRELVQRVVQLGAQYAAQLQAM